MEEKKIINQTKKVNTDNNIIPLELQKAGIFIAGTVLTMALGLTVVSISVVMVRQLVKANL